MGQRIVCKLENEFEKSAAEVISRLEASRPVLAAIKADDAPHGESRRYRLRSCHREQTQSTQMRRKVTANRPQRYQPLSAVHLPARQATVGEIVWS